MLTFAAATFGVYGGMLCFELAWAWFNGRHRRPMTSFYRSLTDEQKRQLRDSEDDV